MRIRLIPTNGTLINITQFNHGSGTIEALTYYASNNTYVAFMKYNVTVLFNYFDKLNSVWINDGANCSILFDGVYYYNTSTVTNGLYSWNIPTYNRKAIPT